jgi:hypothetical protein
MYKILIEILMLNSIKYCQHSDHMYCLDIRKQQKISFKPFFNLIKRITFISLIMSQNKKYYHF